MGPKRKVLAAFAVMALLAGACGGPSPGGEQSPPEEKIRIGLVLPTLTNEAILDIKIGAEQRAKELGNVEVITAASEDAAENIKAFENFVATGVDAIGFDAVDSVTISRGVEAANAAGIPVIPIIASSESGELATRIGTDFTPNGKVVGEWLRDRLGGQGNVALVEGDPADQAAVQLKQGFVEGLGTDGIELVASQPAFWDRPTVLSVAADILTANPDLQAIYGMNDDTALGVLQSLREAGRAEDTILVGHNGTCEALVSLLKGDLDFTVMLFNQATGALFVDLAIKASEGEPLEDFYPLPIFGIDTATAQAILDGSQEEPPDLNVKERLEEAEAGC